MISTVTIAPKAECPEINPSYTASFPEEVDKPSILAQPILEALNRGISFKNLRMGVRQVISGYSMQTGKLEPVFYKDNLTSRDLTGDRVPEIIFEDWEWLSVFSCSHGKYIQVFDRTGFLSLQIVDTGIQDLNSDGLPEMYFRLLDHMPINGAYYLYVYEWNGSQFQNLIILNKEDYTESDYPGAYYHGTASDFSFQKNIKKGTFDIVIRGEVSCLPCETAGPWRRFTDAFTWNGSGFLHLPKRLDPPVYRFQAVQDGDLEMWRGNYALALQFYEQALVDQRLKGWSKELFLQQNDIVRAEAASMPTPTPLPPDPEEFAVLSGYIQYRMMLLQAVMSNPESVRSKYETFRQGALPGQPGYDYLSLATVFWNTYNNTHDLSASCLTTRQYAKDQYDAIFTPINDAWHGWQSPGHMGNPSDEQLICPFE